jgi:hypothetical protein
MLIIIIIIIIIILGVANFADPVIRKALVPLNLSKMLTTRV